MPLGNLRKIARCEAKGNLNPTQDCITRRTLARTGLDLG